MKNLVIIDSRILDIPSIMYCLLPDTDSILFDYVTETYDSLEKKIAIAGYSYTNIAIMQHNYIQEDGTFRFIQNEPPCILNAVETVDSTLTSWSAFIGFIRFLYKIIQNNAKTIDFLACNIWSNPDWVYVINMIRVYTDIHIRASVDITGYGGNFILESDNVDLVGLYFTPDILLYKYNLVPPPNQPQITSIVPNNRQMSVFFTCNDNGSTITSMKYSLNSNRGILYDVSVNVPNGFNPSPLVIGGLENGTVYDIYIKATNAGGDSISSLTYFSTPCTLPDPPIINSVISPISNAIDVSFSPPAYNGDNAITRYWYTYNGLGYDISISSIPSIFRVSGLLGNTTYTIKMHSENIMNPNKTMLSILPSFMYRVELGDLSGNSIRNYANGLYDCVIQNSAQLPNYSLSKTGNTGLVCNSSYTTNVTTRFVPSNSEASVCFWIYKNTSVTGTYPRIIELSNVALSGGSSILFNDVSRNRLQYFTGGIYTNLTDISDITWTHVALIFDASKQITIYVNGTVITNKPTTASVIFPKDVSNVILGIGCKQTGVTSNNFNGYLDDIRIYNGKLTAMDVSYIYNLNDDISQFTTSSPITTSLQSPSPPSFLTLTQNTTTNHIDVSFGAPVTNNGSPITNYYYTYTGQSGYIAIDSNIPVAFSIANPVKGTPITVRILAQNIVGNSSSTSNTITCIQDTVYFNGTVGSYIDISNTSDLSFGTGDFTIEWMQYSMGTKMMPYLFQKGTIGSSIEFNNLFYCWPSAIPLKIENYKNRWVHIAISRVTGTRYVFFDGLLMASVADSVNYTNTAIFTIGNKNVKSTENAFQGYLYNFHIVKGVGKYGGGANPNFVVNNGGLSVSTNTVALINGYDVSGSSASSVNKVGVVKTFLTVNTVPGQVSSVSVAGGYKQAVCRFTAPTYTGGSPVSGYKYSIDNRVTYLDTNSTAPYFVIRDLSDGVNYTVMIVAYNKYGSGIPTVGTSFTSGTNTYIYPQTPNIFGVVPIGENMGVGYTKELASASAPAVGTSYSYAVNDGSYVNVSNVTPAIATIGALSLSVIGNTSTSVTIGYTKPSHAVVGYYYKVTTQSGFVTDGSFSSADYPSSYTINGVIPNIYYRIGLQAIDANGLGPRRAIAYYYQSDTPAAVNNLTAPIITNNSIYVRYSVPITPPTVNSYDIVMQPITGGRDRTTYGFTDVSYLFMGLSEGKSYTVNIYAVNPGGRSMASSITTTTYIASVDISVNLTRGYYMTAVFSGNTTIDSGSVTSYKLEYRSRTDGTGATVNNAVSGSNFNGVVPSSTYDLSFTVFYANTQSIVKNVSFSTINYPSPPISLDISKNGFNNIILKIGKPSGTFSSYVVKTYQGSNFIKDISSTDIVSNYIFTDITGLLLGTNYIFYVYTTYYDASSILLAINKTTYSIVYPITGLSSSATGSSLYISYSPPIQEPIPTSYDISVNPPVSGNYLNYTDTSFSFTGINGYNYIIKVYAKNSGYISTEASFNSVTLMSAPQLSFTAAGRYITATFIATPINGNSGSISGNTIVYAKRGGSTIAPISVTSGYVISGLDPSSVYDLSLTTQYQKVKSVTAGITITTLSTPNPPSSITLGTISYKQITIILGKPTGALPFTGYVVKTLQSSTFISDTSSNDNVSASVNITISALTTNTTYTFQAFTYYSDLSSGLTTTVNGTTLVMIYAAGLSDIAISSVVMYYNFETPNSLYNKQGNAAYNLSLNNGPSISTTSKKGSSSLYFSTSSNNQYAARCNASYSNAGSVSISFWCYGSTNANYINLYQNLLFNQNNNYIYISYYSSILYIDTKAGALTRSNNYSYSLGAGWNHIVITMTGSEWRYYINNVNVKFASDYNNPCLPTGSMNIVDLYGSSSTSINGYIDDVYVFNTILTAIDVSALYWA